MATRRAERVASNYRVRLRAVRAEVARRLGIAYGRVTEADIRASYAEFVPVAARTFTAGQARAQTLTRAYIRGVGGFDPLPVPPLAGTSEAGTIEDALMGIMPFVLGAIARGETPPDALGIGQSYVERMADNELTRVVDAEIEGQAPSGRAIGWEAIIASPSDACVGNAGFHTFDEEIYRHPGCNCERVVVFA